MNPINETTTTAAPEARDELCSTGTAARLLGLSELRTRQLDDLLHPAMMPNGRRVYRLSVVRQVAAERAAKKAERQAKAAR